LPELNTVLHAIQRMKMGDEVKITVGMVDPLAKAGDSYHSLGMMAAAIFAILKFATVGPARGAHGFREAKAFSADGVIQEWKDYEEKYEAHLAENDPTRARVLLGFQQPDSPGIPRFSTVRAIVDGGADEGQLKTETDVLGYSKDDIQRALWIVICYIRKRQTPGSFIPMNKSSSKNEKIFYMGDGEEEKMQEQKKATEERERSKQQRFLSTYYGCLTHPPLEDDLVPSIRDETGERLRGDDAARLHQRLA
jgi:hypothetical protein